MKKRFLALIMATAMVVTVLPVSAAEVDQEAEQELTNIENAGNTAVEADIVGEDTGDISYIIAIPERIDFGTLKMPADDSVAHPKTVGFNVSAIEINGLDTSTSRVAVLMKDSSAEIGKFQISGTSGTNMGKILEYSVFNSQGVDLTTGRQYANGYAFAAFSAAGQEVEGTLSLEQNQLLADKEIANWAGDYLGTINFYTAIADLSNYN